MSRTPCTTCPRKHYKPASARRCAEHAALKKPWPAVERHVRLWRERSIKAANARAERIGGTA